MTRHSHLRSALLRPFALAVASLLTVLGGAALSPLPTAAAPAPIVVDDFSGQTAGARTVTELPAPDTSTTAPGTFSESSGVATMTMTGDGNGVGGIELGYALPHLDLTSQGNNTQFSLVFPSINRSNTTQTDTVAADISVSLTGGGTTGTYTTSIGNVTDHTIALNFSCAESAVCFTPAPDFTDVTDVTVTITYPHNDDSTGVTTVTLDSINTTPTGESAPSPATPTITSPTTPYYGSSGTTLSFPVAFAADGQPASVQSASTGGALGHADVDVSGTAAGTSTYSVTGSGADYTITVGPLTGDGTVVVSIPAGAAVDTWAQPTLASNVVTVDFAIPVAPLFTGTPPRPATVGDFYSYQFTAGGTPAPTFSVTRGELPNGLTLSADGKLSGTPLAGGTYPITVTATNIAGSATGTSDLIVYASAAITSPDSATFVVGQQGSFAITTSGYPTPTLSFSTTTMPDGLTLTNHGGGLATISGRPAVDAAGSTQVTVTAANDSSTAQQVLTINVDLPPAISANRTATFVAGTRGSFDITTVGVPDATLTETGALPDGLTFTDNGDGTATIAGNPSAADAGTTTIAVTAANRSGTARADFLIVVEVSPSFISADTATFTAGAEGTFTVATAGRPVSSLTETGALPDGFTFTDNGDGTATISGTPTAAEAGSIAITLTATSDVGTANQQLTIVVQSAPAITSGDSATFSVNDTGGFTVTATGYPAPALSAGTLPDGLTFTDNGDGTATLSGAPTATGTGPVTITAENAVGTATQTLTVTVVMAPEFTSADNAIFIVGTAGSFTVSATGYPAITLSAGTLPDGLTFTDNGDGTASIAGAPTADAAGDHQVVLTATSGNQPPATMTLTLKVKQAPAFTSPATASFQAGVAGRFEITTIGVPPPTLTLSGVLPDGLTFTDNGDGTALIAGTPAADATGDYTVTINATNDLTDPPQTLTLTVVPAPAPTSTAPPSATPTSTPTSTTPTTAATPTSSTLSGLSTASDEEPLATTGRPIEQLLLVGAALLVVGAVVLVGTRTRRRSS